MNANDFALRTIAPQDDPLRYPMGVSALDAILGGGVARGRVHEVYAANPDDAAGVAGFAALLTAGVMCCRRPLVWLRTKRAAQVSGIIRAEGLAELCGATPRDYVFVLTEDSKALLRASLDAARCADLGVVVIEGPGRMPELDLTASRRLSLAVEKSGVTLLLLRVGADPVPSAAETRWSVESAPSCALAANAPGLPTFDIELLRQRSGPSGMRWRLEWNRDQSLFQNTAISGAVVPVSLNGPPADRGAGSLPSIAQCAA